MEYPRLISSPSGKDRWQGANGLSYETYEEAAQFGTFSPSSEMPPPFTEAKAATWFGALLCGGLSLGSLWACYAVASGHFSYRSEGLNLFIGGGAFLIGLSLARACLLSIKAIRSGNAVGFDTEKTVEEGFWFVGCGLALLAVAVVVGFSVYGGLAKLFDGMSKSATAIVVLLFLILIALISRQGGKR